VAVGIAEANSNTDEATLRAAIAAAPGDDTRTAIEIEGTVELTAALGGTLQIPTGKHIALSGGVLSATGNFITVTVGGTLTLKDVTITHDVGATGGGVLVNSSGVLSLEDGAQISDNTGASGAGVDNNGTFTMSGGVISGNTARHSTTSPECGGGVFNKGTFFMTGGEIADNIADQGGGVYNWGFDPDNPALFTMQSDATISGNLAHSQGGGVHNAYGAMVLSGTIARNATDTGGQGGGVYSAVASSYPNSSSILSASARISGNTAGQGGGVFSSGGDGDPSNFAGSTLILDGATITKNSAISEGGGIYNASNYFEMTSGLISHNTATTGAGIFHTGNLNANFAMISGTISGNSATKSDISPDDGSGGGIYVDGAMFTMEAGTISDNTATGRGGGMLNDGGLLTMIDGSISGNTAGSNGGGVYTSNGAFSMAGMITDNSAGDSGGGVYTTDYNFLSVIYGRTVTFGGNTASYSVDPDADDQIRLNFIDRSTQALSTGFGTAFTNYDINYSNGTAHYLVVINNDGNGAASANQLSAVPGDVVTLAAVPSSGFMFDYWETNENDVVVLSDIHAPDATFTMPSSSVTLTAHFKQTPGDDPGTTPGDDPGTTEPEDDPGTTPGDDPGTTPGDDPSTTEPEDKPGTTPGDDPDGTTPDENPGATEPEDDPGTTTPQDEPDDIVPEDEPDFTTPEQHVAETGGSVVTISPALSLTAGLAIAAVGIWILITRPYAPTKR